MFPLVRFGMFMGISIVVVNAELSRFLGPKYDGKKIFGKEGKELNLTWEYQIESLPPYGTKVLEFLFGEWINPGFVSKKCLKVDENGKVLKAKNFEAKYGYKPQDVSRGDGIYGSNVAIYNLTKSDMEKTYGIDIEMGIYRVPLEDWFELSTFVKAKIARFFISRNATVKKGDAVNITCRATGGPEPNVTLYKEGHDQVIKKGEGEVVHQINEAAMHHAGVYKCVASNDDAEAPDSRDITLFVRSGAVQSRSSKRVASGSKKCFSEPWILGFVLLFARCM